MKKVYLNAGHGGSNPGAVGYLIEKDINLKMALACKSYLESMGVEVKISRTEDKDMNLTNVINECNEYNPDVAVDCHNNAGNGNGFEVYHSIFGEAGKILARNIEAEVIKIGQNSRGLKTRVGSSGRDYFGFIRGTVCPAVICEGVFVDNEEDYKLASTDEGCEAFGRAYAKGILKTLGVEDRRENTVDIPTEPEKPAVEGYLVKVTATALNIRSGAGLNYKVTGMITDKGVYTIMETKEKDGYNWGRLKSGAGWIALEYTKPI